MARVVAHMCVFAFMWLGCTAGIDVPLDVELSAEKTEYVLNEPMRFRVQIVNASDRPVVIVRSRWLRAWPGFVGLSIAASDGRVLELSRGFLADTSHNALGDTLLPWARVEVILRIGPVRRGAHSERDRGRFRGISNEEPGIYRVRAQYSVNSHYDHIWSGTVYSNEIKVRVRDADPSERELLEAYWTGIVIRGEVTGVDADTTLLREAIRRHPDSAVTVHAQFQLAKALMALWASDPSFVRDGVTILRELIDKRGDYRVEEVYWTLGVAHLILHEFDRAKVAFQDGLELNPLLYTDFWYMSRLTASELGRIHGSGEWDANRPRVIGTDLKSRYEKALSRVN